MGKNTQQVHLRLKNDTYAKIVVESNATDRSVNQVINDRLAASYNIADPLETARFNYSNAVASSIMTQTTSSYEDVLAKLSAPQPGEPNGKE